MNPAEQTPGDVPHPLARTYVFLCCGALAVLMLAFVQRGIGLWGLLPILVGLIGVVTRWSAAPVLLIVTVVLVQEDLWYLILEGYAIWPYMQLSDLIIAAAVLGYVAGHYRLQGLFRFIVPPDLRIRSSRVARLPRSLQRTVPQPRQVRSPQLLSIQEITLLLVSLPSWAGMAAIIWVMLPGDWEAYRLGPHVWRTLIFAWIFFIGLVVTSSLLGYIARLRMSRQEALQLLQDVLWQETRGPQRLVSRWLAWFRLPSYHRKDLP